MSQQSMGHEPDENDLQVLFDATAFEPAQSQLHRSARAAARIPSERPSLWQSIFRVFQHPAVATVTFTTAIVLCMAVQTTEQLTKSADPRRVAANPTPAASSVQADHFLDHDPLMVMELVGSDSDFGFDLLYEPGDDINLQDWGEVVDELLEES